MIRPFSRFGLRLNLPYAESLAFMELPEAVLIVDGEGRAMEANRAARYLFGLKGRQVSEREADAVAERLAPIADELRGDGGSCDISLRVGSEERDFSVQTSSMERRGKRVGLVASFIDVTTINNTGRALRRMRDRLEGMVRERTSDLEGEVAKRREAEGLLILLNEELRNTQKEIMLTLSEIVENRSKETANHVLRVGQYTYILAGAAGVGEERASMIRDAAPLHDIGKVAIPDVILNKPSGLEVHEWDVMRTHTEIGYEILKGSQRDLLKVAAIIAREHHERWDGTGYPRRLKGEEISLEGRLVALADVVDALFSRRNYKDPWDFPRIAEYVAAERGKHFQPELVDAFEERIEEIQRVTEAYPDAAGAAVRL
jgi:putative nucleotidyltransferase with HDIG domain/PAS domain S-box-containing protein